MKKLFLLAAATIFAAVFARCERPCEETGTCLAPEEPGESVIVNVNQNFKVEIYDDGDDVMPGTEENACKGVNEESKADCVMEVKKAGLTWGDCDNEFLKDAPTCPKTWVQCTASTSTCPACIYPHSNIGRLFNNIGDNF